MIFRTDVELETLSLHAKLTATKVGRKKENKEKSVSHSQTQTNVLSHSPCLRKGKPPSDSVHQVRDEVLEGLQR